MTSGDIDDDCQGRIAILNLRAASMGGGAAQSRSNTSRVS